MLILNSPEKIDGKRVLNDPNKMIDALKSGETIYHWEGGTSLAPLINDREYCIITPCHPIDVKRGDCVFCEVQGIPMVHQVWEISDASHTNELWFKIGSTNNAIYGWTKKIYGIAKGTDIYQEFS